MSFSGPGDATLPGGLSCQHNGIILVSVTKCKSHCFLEQHVQRCNKIKAMFSCFAHKLICTSSHKNTQASAAPAHPTGHVSGTRVHSAEKDSWEMAPKGTHDLPLVHCQSLS